MHVQGSPIGAYVATLRQRSSLSVTATAAQSAEDKMVQSVSAAMRTNAAVTLGAATGSDESAVYDAAVMRKQKASLNILTQDGDTIAIRFRSREAMALQTSSPAGEGGDAVPADIRLYAFASGRVEIALQGQLDDEELAAIGDLMEKVDALATQFFGGDMESAFAAAADLGFDSSEIAGFSLRLSQKESARVARVPEPALPEPAPPEAALPAPAAEVPAPANAQVADAGEGAAEAVPSPPVDAQPPAAAEQVEGVAVVDEPAAAPASAPTLQDVLGSYLNKLMGTLAESGGAGRLEFSMSWKLRLLASAVQTPPQPAAADPAAAKLLGETLQEVAASQA